MLEVPDSPVAAGEIFDVPVQMAGLAAGVAGYGLQLEYDPSALEIVSARGPGKGPLSGPAIWNPSSKGRVDIFHVGQGVPASGPLEARVTISFRAKDTGEAVQVPIRVGNAPSGGVVEAGTSRLVQAEDAVGIIRLETP